MALIKDESGKIIRDTSPSRVLRDDYRKHGIISYAEAADYSGVEVNTIKDWINNRKRGRGAVLPVARRTGPYRIDLLELDKFLRRGLK